MVFFCYQINVSLVMASYNWKDHLDKDLWHRYDSNLISANANSALSQAQKFAEKYIEQVREEFDRKYDREGPNQLEFALDLLLNARIKAKESIFAELFRNEDDNFELFRGLKELRNIAYLDKRNESVGQCPRLFISHKQVDYPLALRIAKLAIDEGMQVWLDVIDPTMIWLNTVGKNTFTHRQRQLIIAVVIEMALLHSSHVMAVISPNSKGSGWIGYEYGRVKNLSLFSLQAACWLHPALSYDPWEYLLLGVNTYDEKGIKSWLSNEIGKWGKRYSIYSCCKEYTKDDWRDEWYDPPTLPGS